MYYRDLRSKIHFTVLQQPIFQTTAGDQMVYHPPAENALVSRIETTLLSSSQGSARPSLHHIHFLISTPCLRSAPAAAGSSPHCSLKETSLSPAQGICTCYPLSRVLWPHDLPLAHFYQLRSHLTERLPRPSLSFFSL